MEIKPKNKFDMKTKKSICYLFIVYLILGMSSFQAYADSIGLNIYCDPIGTYYMSGSPLFDLSSATTISLKDYLATKGLNEFCDPLDTIYIGGTPLFDSSTGKSISKEQYLRNKTQLPT